jgi:hypothetical protein
MKAYQGERRRCSKVENLLSYGKYQTSLFFKGTQFHGTYPFSLIFILLFMVIFLYFTITTLSDIFKRTDYTV